MQGGFLALAGIVLSACTADGTRGLPAAQPTVYPPAVFAHRVAAEDVEIYWNCTRPTPDVLQLDGVAKNIGGREVRSLELELDSVDAKNRNLLRAATSLPDIVLYTNQISPFRLQLQTGGAEVRFDLFYQYRLRPRIGTLNPGAEERRSMARDVCSETQHRLR
jgi:hypothetical protein